MGDMRQTTRHWRERVRQVCNDKGRRAYHRVAETRVRSLIGVRIGKTSVEPRDVHLKPRDPLVRKVQAEAVINERSSSGMNRVGLLHSPVLLHRQSIQPGLRRCAHQLRQEQPAQVDPFQRRHRLFHRPIFESPRSRHERSHDSCCIWADERAVVTSRVRFEDGR